MEDSKKRIWIGSTNGVNLFYPDNMLFDNFPGTMLSNDIVSYIAEDHKKRIWIGTRDGLNLFDENSRSFVTFNTRKDFPKGTIYGTYILFLAYYARPMIANKTVSLKQLLNRNAG